MLITGSVCLRIVLSYFFCFSPPAIALLLFLSLALRSPSSDECIPILRIMELAKEAKRKLRKAHLTRAILEWAKEHVSEAREKGDYAAYVDEALKDADAADFTDKK